MLMEKIPDFNEFDAVYANDILDGGDFAEIANALRGFLGSLSIEELYEQEDRIKKSKVLEKLRKQGEWYGQDIILDDHIIVDGLLKEQVSGGGAAEVDGDDTDEPDRRDIPSEFYTSDVLSADDSKRLSREHPSLFKKVLGKQFYRLSGEMEQYYDFVHHDGLAAQFYSGAGISNDLQYLADLKKRIIIAPEDTESDSVRFEQKIAKGIAVADWLSSRKREYFDVGKIKHTTQYDDFINHVDYYCPMRVFGKRINVAFDATSNSSEDTMLLKLDQGTSSEGIPPFGFNYVKYCHIDEDRELKIQEEREIKKMPLYKISLDNDERIGFGYLNEEFRSVATDGARAIEFLSQVGNEQLFGTDEYLELSNAIESGGPYDDEIIQKFEIAHRNMNNLKDLTTSFFVLSEIHEQNLLILEENDRVNRNKFSSRLSLTDSDIDSVKKLDCAIWRSLSECMRRLVHLNGANDLVHVDSEELYEKMKLCAGVGVGDDEIDESSEFGHSFGLKLKTQDGIKTNRCYVNMMECVNAEREDIVYREVVHHENGSMRIVARRYRKQLEMAASEKDLAREIFGSIAFDSYLDNFEELFQIAKETNSVKAFIERLGKDDSEDDYGRMKKGMMRFIGDDGVLRTKSINAIGAANHDDIILALFENDQDRDRYFAGKNKDYAADCLSDECFKDDDAVRRLLNWGVSEGRICYVFSSRFGLSDTEAKRRVNLLKQK